MKFVRIPAILLHLSVMLAAILWVGCDRTVVPKNTGSQDDQLAGSQPEQSIGIPPEETSLPAPGLLSSDLSSDISSDLSSDLPTEELDKAQSDATGQDDQTQQRVITIPSLKSPDPAQMVQHLADIDREIQNLLVTTRRMDEEAAKRAAIELSQMKLEAARHLASLSDASSNQRLMARKTQLIALSHLSGLKDVQAAKQLSEYAAELASDEEPELRHQAKIVLFGFQIQELQNGILDNPEALVQSAKQLVADPNYRSRLEMTSLAHATNVLHQMGFAQEARQLEQLVFDAFSESSDRELRNESWNQLTRNSQSVANFLTSLQSLRSNPSDSGLVLAAARNVLQEHPNAVTLEMVAGVITDTEYGGHLGLSRELARLVDEQLQAFPSSVSVNAVTAVLSEHRQRVDWIGQKLELLNLVDMEGMPLNPAGLEDRVVLVDFWATWCTPCLQEIPFLKKAVETLSEKGFEIVSVNMDKDPVRLSQFLQNNRFPWRTYRVEDGDTRALTERFGITMFPHTILVRRDGTIESLHLRGERLIPEVERLLQESPAD
jgi:thiol-disulfide isomerase/thioredoxin